MSFADALTVLRLGLVPCFLWAFLDDRLWLALLFFAVAGATDLIDGTLARILKHQTALGAVLDPLADKILMVASFACLWWVGVIPLWFLFLVAARDIMIGGGIVFLRSRQIPVELRPLWSSKWATLFQLATAVFGMMGVLFPNVSWGGVSLSVAASFFLYVATLLVGISGLQYFRRGWNLLKHA